jgi:hypothetical protein
LDTEVSEEDATNIFNPEDGHSIFLRIVGIHTGDYTVSQLGE